MFYIALRSRRGLATAASKTNALFHPVPGIAKDSSKAAIITCAHSRWNLSAFEKADSEFKSIPLASIDWKHRSVPIDHFTIHATTSAEGCQAGMVPLQDFFARFKRVPNEQVQANLRSALNITQLTPTQVVTMPTVHEGQDTLIASEPGSGKTLAYLLPVIDSVLDVRSNKGRGPNTPLAVILTPNVYLAQHIAQLTERLCEGTGLKVKLETKVRTLLELITPETARVDIAVAPLRIFSKLCAQSVYRTTHVRHVIVDEADMQLSLADHKKLSHFLQRFPFHTNANKKEEVAAAQLVLATSAMSAGEESRLRDIVDASTLKYVVSPNFNTVRTPVEQSFMRLGYKVAYKLIVESLKRDLAAGRPAVVFCNRQRASKQVTRVLLKSDIKCLNVTDYTLTNVNPDSYELFRNGKYKVLVTTDKSSRGHDLTRARHVYNFSMPGALTDYLHRIGRIGRVGTSEQSGLVTNYVDSAFSLELVQRIEHAARTNTKVHNLDPNRSHADLKKAALHEDIFYSNYVELCKSTEKYDDLD